MVKNLQSLSRAKRIVIKVGTTSLTNNFGEINPKAIKQLVSVIAELKKDYGKQIILVTSGAIGAGMSVLGFNQRPGSLAKLQMAAAVGQSRLMGYYDQYFSEKQIASAQVLLTHADIKSKVRSLNIRNLLDLLLKSDVIPVINENDAVAVDEIRVGDNDSLACMVAMIAEADLLVFLTSSNGLMKNISDKSTRIPYLEKVDSKILKFANGKTSKLSTGGMTTKLLAAKKALQSKIPSLIMNSADISKLGSALQNDLNIGTRIGRYQR